MAETLDSVIAQTHSDFEVIVVDDGSKDQTLFIVKQYQEKYPEKIRLIQKENGGPASARNVGIKAAFGEYVAFIDADDIWLPDKLKKQVAYFETQPSQVGLIYTRAKKFDENGIWTRPKKYNREPVKGWIYEHILRDNIIPNLSAMVRKKCFEDVGFFDESLDLIEDHDMWLRIARHYEISFLDEVLCLHREHQLGRSKVFDTTIKRNIGVYEKHLKMVEGDAKLENTIIFYMAQKYYDLGSCYLKEGKMSSAREMFRKSIEMSFLIKTCLIKIATYFPFKLLDLSNKVFKFIFKPDQTVKSKSDLERVLLEVRVSGKRF